MATVAAAVATVAAAVVSAAAAVVEAIENTTRTMYTRRLMRTQYTPMMVQSSISGDEMAGRWHRRWQGGSGGGNKICIVHTWTSCVTLHVENAPHRHHHRHGDQITQVRRGPLRPCAALADVSLLVTILILNSNGLDRLAERELHLSDK